MRLYQRLDDSFTFDDALPALENVGRKQTEFLHGCPEAVGGIEQVV